MREIVSHGGDVGLERLAWNGVSRKDMHVKLRELYEQEKRQSSVIPRSFNSANPDIVKKYNDICVLLNVGQISLSGLSQVEATSLFRAKIEDKKRSFLLSRVKELRSSEAFRSVYIQRDLTYKQRQEMVARRSTFNVSGRQMSQRFGGTSSFLL